jgi:hypothetical protein
MLPGRVDASAIYHRKKNIPVQKTVDDASVPRILILLSSSHISNRNRNSWARPVLELTLILLCKPPRTPHKIGGLTIATITIKMNHMPTVLHTWHKRLSNELC